MKSFLRSGLWSVALGLSPALPTQLGRRIISAGKSVVFRISLDDAAGVALALVNAPP